jgi:hypothetical protein
MMTEQYRKETPDHDNQTAATGAHAATKGCA